MSLKFASNSEYISYSRSNISLPTLKKKRNYLSISFSAILFITILLTFISPLLSAKADTNDTLDDLADDYGAETGLDSFFEIFDKAENETDQDSFGYIFQRLLSVNYLNDVSDGVAASGYSTPSNGALCNVDDPNAGTILYHNCDIPNVTTEFLQDTLSLLIESGPSSDAENSSNKLFSDIFMPSGIGEIPVDPDERGIKYTAYELYGYNLKYTIYNGEWDYIKVLTPARAMSNFGVMDNIRLGASAVVDGVTSGLKEVVNNIGSSLSNGDILSAVGSLFTWGDEAASASINTILDSSDLNVANTYAWYRVGFSSTTYGIRELTETEISALMKKSFYDMVTQNSPANAQLPSPFVAISDGPLDPLKAISSCLYLDYKGDKVEVTGYDTAPGVSRSICMNRATYAYNTRVILAEDAGEDTSTVEPAWYEFDLEGKQKAETLQDWVNSNSSYFSTATSYGMVCTVNVNATNMGAEVATLRSCWTSEWARVADELLYEIQTENNVFWWQSLMEWNQMQEWYKDPQNNFNAPWNRYICLNSDGTDMISSGSFVYTYNSNGTFNSSCSEVRSPIQNGLFGNGYLDSQNSPSVDTRAIETNIGIMNIISNSTDEILNSISNFLLKLSSFFNIISNLVLKLAFSPILDSLGIKGLIASFITGFKNSLFMPFAILVIAAAGVQILFKAGKERNYAQQFRSILFIILTYISGLVLMYNPDKTIDAVDAIPARIESALLGLAFGTGFEDTNQVCTASSYSTGIESDYIDLAGNALSSNSSDAVRNLMCENWRVFVFNTWVNGQWGTGYDNLYSAQSSADDKMANTNEELVGDASVNLGGGITERNWALYQLEVTSSGTTTTTDDYASSGEIDKNFYRIIDLQAGPNNGEGTDSRFFESWSGNHMMERLGVNLFGVIASALGSFTIISYSITKITIGFTTTMMILFLPFMFLIGLHPTQGRSKLKAYLGNILGLMIQRIMLVFLLIIMLRLLMAFGNSSTAFYINGTIMIVVCLAFIKYKKYFMDMIADTMNGRFGNFLGSQAYNFDQNKIINSMPTSVRNYYYEKTSGISGAIGGGIAGFVVGSSTEDGQSGNRFKFAVDQARAASGFEERKATRRQRRSGFGIFRSLDSTSDKVKGEIKHQIKGSEAYSDVRSTLISDGSEKPELDLDRPELSRSLMKIEKLNEKQTTAAKKLEDLKIKFGVDEKPVTEIDSSKAKEALENKKENDIDKENKVILDAASKRKLEAERKYNEATKKLSKELNKDTIKRYSKDGIRNVNQELHEELRIQEQNIRDAISKKIIDEE